MAPKTKPQFSLKSNQFYTYNNKGRTNTWRQRIALILLCFLSSGWGYPWDFNNTCKEDHLDYETRCDDEFQSILDENSIIVDNKTVVEPMPSYITECHAPDNSTFVVVCADPSWDAIHSDQIPSNVNYLLINNTNVTNIHEDSFSTKDIQILHMTHNPLENINIEGFRGMNRLRTLLIHGSSKWYINETYSFFHPFRHLNLLRQLILEDNQIYLRGIDNTSKSNATILPNLEFLSLKGNNLDRIENNFFWELRNSSLKELNLNSCNLKAIGYSAFNSLPELEHIDLYNNPQLFQIFALSFVRVSFVHSRLPIKSLGLGSNGLFISPYIFSLIFHKGLTRLNLSGNNLHEFGYFAAGSVFDWTTFPPMPNLSSLILQHCNISDVHPNVLDTLPLLTHIDVRRNKIKTLEGLLVPDLEYLDLSHQCIEEECCDVSDSEEDCIKRSRFNLGDTDGFDNMHKLTELRLSGLRVENLNRDGNKYNDSFFRDLSNLKSLDLDRSHLKELSDRTFEGAYNLKRLNLSKNWELNTLPEDVFYGLNNVEVLDLSYCPKAFRKAKNTLGESFSFKLHNLRHLNLTCALLENGDIDHPENCIGNMHSNALDPELLTLVPNLQYIDLSENALVPWPHDLYENMTEMKSIKLRRNNLHYLTEGMLDTFARLKHLDLRDNPFTCDDANNIDYVHQLFFMVQGNPNLTVAGWDNGDGYSCTFKSNGTTVSFKEYTKAWAKNQLPIIKTTTTHKPFTFTPDGLSTKTIISYAVIVLCAMAFSSIITTYAYQNRFLLTYYFIKHRKKLKDRLRNVDPETSGYDDYDYDVFISYSNEETTWVKEQLLPALEKQEPKLKCCVHERDFKVGVAVTENIVDCIDKSRKFLMVLTNSFLKSKWCMFETHLAQSRIILHNSIQSPDRNSLILILKDKDISIGDLDKNLRYILKTWTYIEWSSKEESDKLFWKRLKESCVTSRKSAVNVKRTLSD